MQLNSLMNSTTAKFKIIFSDFINDESCYSMTGLKKAQFNDLISKISLTIKKWNLETCLNDSLFLYLSKLRLGLSIQKIVDTLRITSYDQAKECIFKIRPIFKYAVSDQNVGLEKNTRGDIIINHTTQISKTIFQADEDVLVCVWDGTYIYIEKSSNNLFQKKSFSMHKGNYLTDW